mmetsp:Transcript_34011/g.61168  ORF Transcript_34011/g.61168 Transcript_34011/m.61168 type:complete len:218 (+) Transcript_34011:50-703(+)
MMEWTFSGRALQELPQPSARKRLPQPQQQLLPVEPACPAAPQLEARLAAHAAALAVQDSACALPQSLPAGTCHWLPPSAPPLEPIPVGTVLAACAGQVLPLAVYLYENLLTVVSLLVPDCLAASAQKARKPPSRMLQHVASAHSVGWQPVASPIPSDSVSASDPGEARLEGSVQVTRASGMPRCAVVASGSDTPNFAKLPLLLLPRPARDQPQKRKG